MESGRASAEDSLAPRPGAASHYRGKAVRRVAARLGALTRAPIGVTVRFFVIIADEETQKNGTASICAASAWGLGMCDV